MAGGSGINIELNSSRSETVHPRKTLLRCPFPRNPYILGGTARKRHALHLSPLFLLVTDFCRNKRRQNRRWRQQQQRRPQHHEQRHPRRDQEQPQTPPASQEYETHRHHHQRRRRRRSSPPVLLPAGSPLPAAAPLPLRRSQRQQQQRRSRKQRHERPLLRRRHRLGDGRQPNGGGRRRGLRDIEGGIGVGGSAARRVKGNGRWWRRQWRRAGCVWQRKGARRRAWHGGGGLKERRRSGAVVRGPTIFRGGVPIPWRLGRQPDKTCLSIGEECLATVGCLFWGLGMNCE